MIRRADWVVDVGPGAGSEGGRIVYSGPPAGLATARSSATARFLKSDLPPVRTPRTPSGWLALHDVSRNNLHRLDARIPLGVLCAVTGLSGSGKSSLISQALVELVAEHLGHVVEAEPDSDDGEQPPVDSAPTEGRLGEGADAIRRLVRIDQKPIGRTPRSNLATYTGLFDEVRKLFAQTPAARKRGYDAGRFSFNVAKGRCPTCEGEGFVSVELLFMLRLIARDSGWLTVLPEVVVQDELRTGVLVMLGRSAELREHFYAITTAHRHRIARLESLLAGSSPPPEQPTGGR